MRRRKTTKDRYSVLGDDIQIFPQQAKNRGLSQAVVKLFLHCSFKMIGYRYIYKTGRMENFYEYYQKIGDRRHKTTNCHWTFKVLD